MSNLNSGLTIFTPTYNRAYILHRLYQSLLEQEEKDFEWIIVDDGSTDNTKEIIEKWVKDDKIKINYYYQENQGKQIAHNLGVEKATCELFTCVDSDDFLTKDAVKIIKNKWLEICENPKCIGIVGGCTGIDGNAIGSGMPNVRYGTLEELSWKFGLKGDTILIYKTEIIKKYSFPKIEGEKFVPETYLYDLLDNEGKLATIQDKIYIAEYLNDGYTKNVRKNIMSNPRGYAICYNQTVKLTKNIKRRIKACAKYNLGCILSKDKEWLKNANNKVLTILTWLVGWLYYIINYKE